VVRAGLRVKQPHPHFETASAQETAIAHLRGFLGALERHQDLGLRIGPRDLQDAGFEGVHLLAAQVESAGKGRE
jgi:hypothetical protein